MAKSALSPASRLAQAATRLGNMGNVMPSTAARWMKSLRV